MPLSDRTLATTLLVADVAENAAAATVADVLELDFDHVWRVKQDLGGSTFPHPRARLHVMLYS
jgi:hypothetical protein